MLTTMGVSHVGGDHAATSPTLASLGKRLRSDPALSRSWVLSGGPLAIHTHARVRRLRRERFWGATRTQPAHPHALGSAFGGQGSQLALDRAARGTDAADERDCSARRRGRQGHYQVATGASVPDVSRRARLRHRLQGIRHHRRHWRCRRGLAPAFWWRRSATRRCFGRWQWWDS